MIDRTDARGAVIRHLTVVVVAAGMLGLPALALAQNQAKSEPKHPLQAESVQIDSLHQDKGAARDKPAVRPEALALALKPERQLISASTAFSSRNVYRADSVVHPLTTVEGDFIAVGGRIVLDQFVKGDAMLAAGSVNVHAPVGEDLRAVGGDVNIESAVGGEVFVTAASITLTKEAKIAGMTNLMGGSVVIDGDVAGPLKVNAKSIILNGTVNGDARLAAGQIELGPMAKITGTLRYHASGGMTKNDAAIVGGAIIRDRRAFGEEQAEDGESIDSGWFQGMANNGSMRMGTGLRFFALLACGAVFLLLFPGFFTRASAMIGTSPGLTFLSGVIALLGLPMVSVLLFVTILGIPLGLLLLACYPFFLLTSYVSGVLFVAQRAQAVMRRRQSDSFGVRMIFFAAALLLTVLLRQLTYVGPVLVALLTIAGAGGCARELLQARRQGPGTPSPVSPSMPMDKMQHA